MIRVLPSSPEYDILSRYAWLIMIAKNPAMHKEVDLPELERLELIGLLEMDMQDAIDNAIVRRLFGG